MNILWQRGVGDENGTSDVCTQRCTEENYPRHSAYGPHLKLFHLNARIVRLVCRPMVAPADLVRCFVAPFGLIDLGPLFVAVPEMCCMRHAHTHPYTGASVQPCAQAHAKTKDYAHAQTQRHTQTHTR